MDDNFKVSGGELRIFLPKEVDHHNAEDIRRKADRILETGAVSRVVFDFSETDFMDSSGIGVIMGRYKRICFMGGTLEVLHTNKRMDRILRMAGIYKLIGKRED